MKDVVCANVRWQQKVRGGCRSVIVDVELCKGEVGARRSFPYMNSILADGGA